MCPPPLKKTAIPQPPKAPKSGFALVIALSLMAFVLLLLLSITTLVQVETRTAEISKSQVIARQNALVAAQLALGELQKYAGPDQRITARSDILNPAGTAPVNAGQRFWTGVWDVEPEVLKDGDNTTRLLPGQPFKDIKERAVARWLVSNPSPTVDLDPTNYTQTTNDTVTLYKDPVPKDVNGNPDDQSVRVNLAEIEGAQGQVTGKYAWWVSDEGVKASVGLADAHGSTPDEKERALLSIQRTAPELLNALRDDEGALKLPDSNDYSKIADLQHLSLMIGSAVTDAVETQKELFHDLTVNHQGLAVDVRGGGFKKDLTQILGDDSQFTEFINHDNEGELLFGGVGEVSYNVLYDPKSSFNPELTYRGNSKLVSASSPGPLDPGGPSWEQLSRFYNSHKAVTKGTAQVSPLDDQLLDTLTGETPYGIYPILTHMQVHMHPVFIKNTSSPNAAQPNNMVDVTLTPRLLIIPNIVLWNPYNVALKAQDYYFCIANRNNMGNLAMQLNYIWLNDEPAMNIRKGNGKALRFYVKGLSLEPGESKQLTLKATTEFLPSNWKQAKELIVGLPKTLESNYTYIDGNVSETQVIPNSGNITLTTYSLRIQHCVMIYGTGSSWASDKNQTIEEPLQYFAKFTMNESGKENGVIPHDFPTKPNGEEDNNENRLAWNISYSQFLNSASPLSISSMRDSFSNPSIRSEIFPATGFYAHLRTVENYISDNFKLINRYRILPLAHHNPRAPILSHKWLDNNDGGTQHNPSFYTQPDSFFKRNTDSSAYGLFEDNVAPESGKWPFAFSDYDVNSATIWTAFEIPTGEEYFTSVGNLMHANLTQSGMPSAINWGKQKNVKYEDSYFFSSYINTGSTLELNNTRYSFDESRWCNKLSVN